MSGLESQEFDALLEIKKFRRVLRVSKMFSTEKELAQTHLFTSLGSQDQQKWRTKSVYVVVHTYVEFEDGLRLTMTTTSTSSNGSRTFTREDSCPPKCVRKFLSPAHFDSGTPTFVLKSWTCVGQLHSCCSRFEVLSVLMIVCS